MPKIIEVEVRELPREVIGIIKHVVPKIGLPLKPPRIHGLLNTVLDHRLPPEPSPKGFRVQSDLMDKLNLKWEDNRLNISYITGPKSANKYLFNYFRTNNHTLIHIYLFQDQKPQINRH